MRNYEPFAWKHEDTHTTRSMNGSLEDWEVQLTATHIAILIAVTRHDIEGGVGEVQCMTKKG